jgi:hypothetical protein
MLSGRNQGIGQAVTIGEGSLHADLMRVADPPERKSHA